jgi:hypothetical protein
MGSIRQGSPYPVTFPPCVLQTYRKISVRHFRAFLPLVADAAIHFTLSTLFKWDFLTFFGPKTLGSSKLRKGAISKENDNTTRHDISKSEFSFLFSKHFLIS